MIKAVLWDIDGTLLDFKKSERYALKTCFSRFGLGICDDDAIKRYSAINRTLWEKLEKGEITKQDVLLGRFQAFFKEEQISFDQVEAFNEEYQLCLGDRFFFCEHGLETVTALKGHVKQYAVTNGTLAAQSRKLQKSGLISLFDDIFISDQVGFEKPSREFFQFVWDRIGDCKRHEAIIIGDSLTSDMLGGYQFGILCCWYNPQHAAAPSDIKLDYIIDHLSQVLPLIDHHQ